MQKVNEQKLNRVIDANVNRAKEGLRVCEDISRFILDDTKMTREYKLARHKITDIAFAFGIKGLLLSRNSNDDVGRNSTKSEFRRKNISDVFYANTQRAKESVRVLEEFAKIKNKRLAEELKKIRYLIYGLEKKIIKGL